MCGIFAVLNYKSRDESVLKLADKIAHRGPDSHLSQILQGNLLCFYRLAINGGKNGMQPIQNSFGSVVCNGEIYNHAQITDHADTKSDCESILFSLHQWDLCTAVQKLDGVFAFVAILNDGRVVAARDAFGVRPLFWGKTENGDHAFASESKALIALCPRVVQFPAGSVWDSSHGLVTKYWRLTESPIVPYVDDTTEHRRCVHSLRSALVHAVRKRMMSDRPIGCFVSGGLDSSLVAALVVRECKRTNREPPKLFTISLDRGDCPDLVAARKVAQHLNLPLN